MKIIGAGLALLILLGVGYYLFGRTNFSEARVEFKIDGPSEVTSGEFVTYKIAYQNNNPVALNGVKLTVFYPADAVVIRDGDVANITNETIDLGTLDRGASGERDLSVYIIGDKGNIRTIKTGLTFTPANVHSLFRKELSLATTITKLAIPLTLAVPPSVTNGQIISYLIDYTNQAQQDFTDLRLNIKYPDGFRFTTATPPANNGPGSWNIAKLKQGSGARITIQGILTGQERTSKTVTVTLQKKITTPAGDSYINFEKTEASSVIGSSLLSVNLKVNDSNQYTAHLDDQLEYVLTFKNNSNVDIGGLTLTASLNGTMFELGSVRSNTFFDSRANSLTWNQSTVPALALLRPGQSSSTAFSVRLKNSFSGAAGVANSLVKVSAHLETTSVPAELDLDNLTADDQLVTRISSEPSFGQIISLADSEFGHFGPYPPRVNQRTNFTIRWTLLNPGNTVTGAQVSAVLPPGVKWENQTRVTGSGIVPGYDARTSTVTWNVGNLPAGTGTSGAKYEAAFVVSITPSVNQVNQSPTLLKNSRFEGTDSITLEKISRSVQDSNSGSVNDSNENGSVQP